MSSRLWKLVRSLLFFFDAETAHRLTVRMLHLGIFRWGGHAPLRLISGSYSLPQAPRFNVLGMNFVSPVGLAAGFDKDAEILTSLPSLGFGFVEIGTVTPRPQPGNDRPRLFRDPERRSLFNRMGFNGLGASIVSERVRKARETLPDGFKVGINLGKNKDTPLEQAAEDYCKAAAAFEGIADYLVINVSSPNTPGLRSLQTVEALSPIVRGVSELISGWGGKRPPLLLKLAPEVHGEALKEIMVAAEGWGVDGWVLTNTLAGERGSLAGGWSGAILTERSRASLIEARAMTRKPIISVGGILSVEEAAERMKLGADLVQIYSGWVFNGPAFPAQVARALING